MHRTCKPERPCKEHAVGLVLIADDEPASLESLCDAVEGLGYECVTAHDGDELFDLARARRPDLIITDYMMPGKDGIEAIRALRGTDGARARAGDPGQLRRAARL